MLNREICKKCINSQLLSTYEWNALDDLLWNDYDIVVCPESDEKESSVKKDAIDKCPYNLEHIMKKGN